MHSQPLRLLSLVNTYPEPFLQRQARRCCELGRLVARGKVAVTMRQSGTAAPLPQAGGGAWHRGPRSWKEMTHWDYLGCQQRAEASGKKA